jgi:hypothetical protein
LHNPLRWCKLWRIQDPCLMKRIVMMHLDCVTQCSSPRPFFLCFFTFVKNTFDASYSITMLHLFTNVSKVLCHDLLVLIKLPIPPLRETLNPKP